MTSKGQITLPAALRHLLDLQPGRKLSISLNSENHIVVESPPSMTEIQRKNRELLLARGFTPKSLEALGRAYKNGAGMAAHVKEQSDSFN